MITFTDPPPRSPTQPSNEKVQDSLLNKSVWTDEDGEMLIKILENYYTDAV